ncbi:Uncharacterised protein [Lachnospira eligens]|jgi:hypothetical protein|uniref:Uncharacterized protein n=1 Tax=Lachnospira eligens TaxID=39485 RepID=A0A174YQ43_9FIRM|nr:Uncharacterised protein [Lachnospira eligens]
MIIIQLDKSLETIQSLDINKYNKIYFLTLVESKTRSGTDNYVFRSKRLDYLMFNELESYLNNPEYILVRIEK